MLFKDLATPLIARGIPAIRLRPRMKAPFDSDWPSLATTDPAKIAAMDGDFNCGAVAQAKIGGFWILEIDKPEVGAQIEEQTNRRVPKTYRVRSSPGRGHFYWKQTEKSIQMGNIGQQGVIGASWSARVDREFVVAAGSLHPTTGLPYEVVSTADIVEAPDWLIDWCISQKSSSVKIIESNQFEGVEGPPIPAGTRDNTLASIGGRYRQMGLPESDILHLLQRINSDRCQPPMSDEDVQRIAHSVSRYKQGGATVLVGGVPAGTAQIETIAQQIAKYQEVQKEVQDDPEDVLHIVAAPYPKFPSWIMQGTSIYEGFVKPYCAVNSRIPEFMFMPAMFCMMNYLGTKVRIEMKDIIPNMFMTIIGRRGDTCKSSSVRSAFDYFNLIGTLDHSSPSMTNAEGKSIIWTVGSTEGLGIGMQKTNCKNAILYYDELSKLTSKAGIESSSLVSDLLLLYESDKFANTVKGGKECFALHPRSYCASLIACTTDKMFQINWSRLTGGSTGLDDRFFFLLQPETPIVKKPMTSISFLEGAKKTREIMGRAVMQNVYRIMDSSPLHKQMDVDRVGKEEVVDNREEVRVEKYALYFAIDLGLDEIDDVCIERALALVKYEKQVKRYFKTYESVTREGQVQQSIISLLRRKGGEMRRREVENILHSEAYGTSLWNQAHGGLKGSGIMVEYGKGSKTSPVMWKLLRVQEDDDD